MTLELHLHPLSSFCHKALIAFYENGTPFESVTVDLSDEEKRAAFRKLSPMGKMPALVDRARDRTLWEVSILIEYLDTHYPGGTRLLSGDAEQALSIRLLDRFFDLYIHDPMQRIIADALLPEADRDPRAVERLEAVIRRAYDHAEREIGHAWAAGDSFTLADCAAAPALFYANVVVPIGAERPGLAAYLDRLMARPSYARALEEAKPWFRYYPKRDLLKERYPGLGLD